MKHEVFWKNPGYPGHPTLNKDIECDYLIVGGGVTGVSLAYFLSRHTKKNVVLIEKDTIASGATGRAAGSIVLKGELDIKEIIDIYGEKKGLRYWEANRKGLSLMKQLVKKERIKCDYDAEDTVYGSTHHNDGMAVLDEYIVERDIEPLTRLLVGRELRGTVNTPLFKYALLSHQQGISVNPLQFTQNLSIVAGKRKGALIFENTPLTYVHKNTAITPKAKILFKHIIFAMDAFTRHSGIKKITSTIIVTKPLSRPELKKIGMVPKKIVWDSKDIYHYMKITRDNRILLGYGDKHVRKKHANLHPHKPHIVRIVQFLKKLFPHTHTQIDYAWSGSFGITSNKIPLIERKGNRITVGGAASQVMCVMAAKHISDMLHGKPSAMSEFF